MTTLREAAQQALEALETCDAAHISDGGRQWYDDKAVEEAITALKAALAEPEPPIGKASTDVGVPVYVVKKAEPPCNPSCAPGYCYCDGIKEEK